MIGHCQIEFVLTKYINLLKEYMNLLMVSNYKQEKCFGSEMTG